MNLEDLGNVAGLFDVVGQSNYPRSVVDLEPITDAPSDGDVRILVEFARAEALMYDSTCLRVDCSNGSRVTHHGVVLLSNLPRFHLIVRLLCP